MLNAINYLNIHRSPVTIANPSGSAEGTSPLMVRPGLLHGLQRALLVRIVEPTPFPKITGSGIRRHLGTSIPMQRHTIDRSGDMNPIGHGGPVRGRKAVKGYAIAWGSSIPPSPVTPYRLREGVATHPYR